MTSPTRTTRTPTTSSPTPVEVSYTKAIPQKTFDLVIVGEVHRCIYGVWRGVLDAN